ncbi:hypothetical protein CH330_05075 [candidate division WOR-3 bacterium JGI_Cruoil_03_51_56]|uniref:Uncharacterized protein n=1 Tax=candidate division WOR-3 bacterium JGI_Cruoil_03_51_56 TaxID=1973747 RepID=A0A235BU02_UNCW3|nr:MAG: hypothetical protein CH330_05075 [candidate division WOR-3 bacterium JGI_Cruoil_03_51_56]
MVFNRFIQPQGYEYEAIARSLVEGTGYSGAFTGGLFGATSFMAPLYTYLIYLSFKTFGVGNWWPIQVFQVLLLSLVPLVLLRIRSQLVPDRPGLSWGVLLLPAIVPFTMYSAYIYQSAILILLATTGFYLIFAIARQPRMRYFIKLGILTGIATLTDPILLIPLAIGFVWLLFRLRCKGIIRWLTAGVIALLIASPWLYRNYRVFGAFPAIKIQLGWNLWWGNNPLATGGIHNPDGGDYTVNYDALSPEEKDSLPLWNEWERDKFYGRKAVSAINNWIRAAPLSYLKLKLKCLLFYWFGDAWNIGLKKTLVLRRADPRLAVFFYSTLIPSFLLLFLSIIGIIVGLSKKAYRADTLFFVSVLVPWMGIYILTHGYTFNRFRVPLDPILLLFGLLGLSWIVNRLRSSANNAAHQKVSQLK